MPKCALKAKSDVHFSWGSHQASETRDEWTETPTPKNLPQYVASQVDYTAYRKRCYATPAMASSLRELIWQESKALNARAARWYFCIPLQMQSQSYKFIIRDVILYLRKKTLIWALYLRNDHTVQVAIDRKCRWGKKKDFNLLQNVAVLTIQTALKLIHGKTSRPISFSLCRSLHKRWC